MLRRGLVALLFIGLLGIPQGWASAEYADTAFDPDDRRVLALDPDIRSTTRRVTVRDGHRFLTIAFHAYEALGDYWFVRTRLDSRAGPERDYKMLIANEEGGACLLYRPHEDSVRGKFSQASHRAACRIPARFVRPTKQIRWKIFSPSGYSHGNKEYVPNDGRWLP